MKEIVFDKIYNQDCLVGMEQIKNNKIDLIITDQPNLVLDSGTRPSLDQTVKHQIIFCKINFKIPPLPKYTRHIWHFNRARVNSIKRAIADFPGKSTSGDSLTQISSGHPFFDLTHLF